MNTFFAQYKSCTGYQLFNTPHPHPPHPPPPASKQVSVEEKVSINPSLLLQRVIYGPGAPIWCGDDIWSSHTRPSFRAEPPKYLWQLMGWFSSPVSIWRRLTTAEPRSWHTDIWSPLPNGIYDGKNACFRVSRITKSCLSVCYRFYGVYFFLYTYLCVWV